MIARPKQSKEPENAVGYPKLLAHVLDGKLYGPILNGPDLQYHRASWRSLFSELARCPPRDGDVAKNFHAQWHVSHHFIRELVDCDYLLVDALCIWLPQYEGPALELYRGENIDRLEGGKIGTAWCDEIETAEMFTSGLNAQGKGGVILRTIAPAESIIAGPSDHSANHLGEREFTLDPRRLGVVEQLRRFPGRFNRAR